VLIAMPGEPTFEGSRRELVRTLRPQRVNEHAPLEGLVEILSEPLSLPERPVLLLTAEHDLPTVEAQVSRLAATGLEHLRIPGTSHLDVISHPATLDAAAAWLRERLR